MSIEKTYSRKYIEFINEREECVLFTEKHPGAIETMNSFYNKVFMIMDIANEKQIPCVLKDIFNSIPEMNVIITNLLNGKNMEEDFDGLIAEIQEDVDLILEHGFTAFENKILNLFVEVEKEDKKFKDLMENISKINKDISTQIIKISLNMPTL